MGGNTPFEGRVEIYHNHVWGTMCEVGMGLIDVLVICASLGGLR